MKTNKICLALIFLMLALALTACNPAAGSTSTDETASLPPPPQETTPCAFTWATNPLPDVTSQVQTTLESAGLNAVTVRAEAYGENCTSGDGKVLSFGAMETDFHISLPVASLTEDATLGGLLEKVLVVLDQFKPGQVPGPQPGYIGVEFTSGQDTLRLWFLRNASDSARQQGLHGADLLNALKSS